MAAKARVPIAARVKRRYCLEMAGWCQNLKRDAGALRWFNEALQVVPNDPHTLKCIGFHHAQQGRKRDALAYFDRAVAARADDAETQFDRGFLLQELQDHEAALQAFRAALDVNPDHDRALYGMGLSLVALKRLDEAVPPLERNTRLQPMSPYGWYQLARVQFDRGKPEKTQTIIEHLGTFEPKVAAQLARETGLRPPPRP